MSIYEKAHNLINLAEEGASLDEIAQALMVYKSLSKQLLDPAGINLFLLVPVKMAPEELESRYPLKMINRKGNEKVAVSWPEEQRLRKIGYKEIGGFHEKKSEED